MILHLDADAFFASVEQAEDPSLKGKPMAVGGLRRGIIASASYPARQRGVYTPMPTVQALKVCPELIVIPGNFSKYRQYSDRIFGFAEEFTPWIERTSIDEAYLDLSGNRQMPPGQVARELKAKIVGELGVTVSLGVGSNKLVAQIASKLRKPDALVEVPAGSEREFLAELDCGWLPGVGTKLAERLRAVGLKRVRDIATGPMEALEAVAGRFAPQLQLYAHGIDARPLNLDPEDAKSYGMQETFDDNVTAPEPVLAVLRTMADELMSRVRRDSRAARTITVRLRYSDMSDASHAFTLPQPSDLETEIYPLLPGLLRRVWTRETSVRLVGLRLSHLSAPSVQAELDLDGRRSSKQREAARVLDDLRARSLPVMRGHSLRQL